MLLNPDLGFSQTLRITWRVDLTMIALCTIAYWMEVHVLKDFVHIPTSIPTLLGTSIAFFVGFNNNQAYSRWWEARTIWGALVNDSRSWTRNVLYYVTNAQTAEPLFGRADEQTEDLPLRMVRRHLSFLYALKKTLRGEEDQVYLDFLTEDDRRTIAQVTNIPAALLDMQTRDLQQLRTERRIDGYAFLTLNELIVRFSDGMGGSERIRNTPFPVTYLYFTRLFIWVLVTLLTMVIADEAGSWSIGLGWLVGFVFHVTQINGTSLMNPFDGNPASVALDSIVRTIEINTLQTLKAPQIPSPIETVNNEYIL